MTHQLAPKQIRAIEEGGAGWHYGVWTRIPEGADDRDFVDYMQIPDVDQLAQIIREVDGSNSLGAGALAEAILSKLAGST
jgi:hypothetical protein